MYPVRFQRALPGRFYLFGEGSIWDDENYASIGRLFLGKSRHVFIRIGQSQKAEAQYGFRGVE